MKTISIFLALINSLLAGLLIAFSLSTAEIRDVAFSWLAIKTAGSVTVIGMGILTLFSSIRESGMGTLSLGGVFLIVLGAVTVVWTYHLAVISGDMEYYMVGYGGSLMAQGMASLLGFGSEKGSMTTS